MKAAFFLLLFSLLYTFPLFAQKKNASFQLPIKEITSQVRIDGREDDPVWQETAVAKDFYMMFPMDTSLAKVKTEVRMAYDQDNIYILAINYLPMPGPYVVESLRRDFSSRRPVHPP